MKNSLTLFISLLLLSSTLVLAQDPSFDKGEITEKGSLNQRAMRTNHADAVARLYAGGPGALIV